MKFRELEKIVKADGWELRNAEGSHYHYEHKEKRGKVTIPFHKGDLPRKLISSVLIQAGLIPIPNRISVDSIWKLECATRMSRPKCSAFREARRVASRRRRLIQNCMDAILN